jgi:pyruvate dehydrogenase E2 component (dihydrolipoamide acetyltransferase)
MKKNVIIPHQGFTTQYVTIAKWHVKPGDSVREGAPLLAIESDKSAFDVESPYAGTVLEVLKPEGEEADVGETILIMEVS